MRDRMIQFMRGRYGSDELGRVTMWTSLILIVIFALTRNPVLGVLALLMILWTDFRLFSRNIVRRSAENRWFLKHTAGIVQFLKRDAKERRHYHIYRCPNCKQKIRIPKGKGRIEITCPRCHIEFIKKS